MRRTYPRPERAPMPGERVRTEEGIVGVVIVVLPSRSLVTIADNSGMEHEVPIESVSVIDGDRPMVYLR
jgi:preprotein translocase subunit YajC